MDGNSEPEMDWLFLGPLLIVLAILAALLALRMSLSSSGWAAYFRQYLGIVGEAAARSRHMRRGVLVGVTLGAIASVLVALAAWDHNAMGEIHGPDGLDWWYLAGVAISWGIIVGAFACGLTALVSVAVGGRTHSETSPPPAR